MGQNYYAKNPCSMKIFCKFPTVNISKLNFYLVICIAKNLIWTTLKAIFLEIPDFQIVVSRPNIVLTNHTSMESVFIQLIYKSRFQKMYPYDWFCDPGSQITC